MATLHHEFETGLSVDKAHSAVVRALAEYEAEYPQYEFDIDWTTDDFAQCRFSAAGTHVSGTIQLFDGGGEFKMRVPFFLRGIISRSMDMVDAEILKWAKTEAE